MELTDERRTGDRGREELDRRRSGPPSGQGFGRGHRPGEGRDALARCPGDELRIDHRHHQEGGARGEGRRRIFGGQDRACPDEQIAAGAEPGVERGDRFECPGAADGDLERSDTGGHKALANLNHGPRIQPPPDGDDSALDDPGRDGDARLDHLPIVVGSGQVLSTQK